MASPFLGSICHGVATSGPRTSRRWPVALEGVYALFTRHAAVFHSSIGSSKSTPGCVGGFTYYPAEELVNILNNSRDAEGRRCGGVPNGRHSKTSPHRRYPSCGVCRIERIGFSDRVYMPIKSSPARYPSHISFSAFPSCLVVKIHGLIQPLYNLRTLWPRGVTTFYGIYEFRVPTAANAVRIMREESTQSRLESEW